MFKLFNFNKNKVANSDKHTIISDEIAMYPTPSRSKKRIFICLNGVGDSSEETCYKLYPETTFAQLRYRYPKQNIVHDVLSAYKSLASLTGVSITPKLQNRIRIYRLKNVIKAYLENDDYEYVCLCGVSHGALLFHEAFLKLQMDDTINASHYCKLSIATLGSPRYLPSTLIPRNPNSMDFIKNFNVINIYHISDPFINMIRKISNMTELIKVPPLPSDNCHFIKSKEPDFDVTEAEYNYHYNRSTGIMFVNSKKPEFKDEIHSDSQLQRYHVSTYNMYPFINQKTRYCLFNIMNFKVEETDPIYCKVQPLDDLVPTVGGMNQNKYKNENKNNQNKHYLILCKTKKKYVVRENKQGRFITIKGNAVALATLRGTYRYC